MAATATRTRTKPAPAPARPQLTREQAADRILEILTDEPQTEAAIRRRIKGMGSGKDGVVRSGLGVLEAQHKAMRLPGTTGSKWGGWVLYDERQHAAFENPEEMEFPYEWGIVKVGDMFIDENYQRPLTTFVNRIQARFDPVLFQVLALSDRGARHKPKRYAIIDGQTRWVAASRLKILEVPCTIFKGLTPQDEARIFARLQKERRGMMSWHRFRAALAADNPEAQAIKTLVESVGYTLGDGVGQMRAVAALEATYRIDPYLLERGLADLRAAWPDHTPESPHIRGIHYFFRHYPIGQKKNQEVDDEKLVRRLKASGPDSLKSKAFAAKTSSIDGKGSAERWMGQAIQNVYVSK